MHYDIAWSEKIREEGRKGNVEGRNYWADPKDEENLLTLMMWKEKWNMRVMLN